MCGIVGYVGKKEVVPVIIEGLRRLEYRGYDSAGIAVSGNGDKLPPDAPRSYPLSQAAPVADDCPGVQVDHRVGAHFFLFGFWEPGAGLGMEAEKNCWNFD